MPEIIMPESLKPESEFAFNLDLFLRVIPSIRVNDRIIRLDTIEHIGFGFPPDDEMVGDENETAETIPMLEVTFKSGNVIYFDQDEQKILQNALEAAIKNAEEQAKAQQEAQAAMLRQAALVNPGGIPDVVKRGRFGRH